MYSSKVALRDYFTSELIETGSRINDQIIIFPFLGRKKRIVLNRTHYDLVSDYSAGNCQIELGISKTKNQIELKYSIDLVGEKEEELGGRYLLRSHCSKPFRINGNYSFESFVERGDEVIIDYNRICFIEHKEDQKPDFMLDSRLVESDLSVLLEGETGTGKSHLAFEIHKRSKLVGPFVHINISAFSPSLIESELFGHVKGAFTGAERDKKGALLDAKDGTLFIDEIDSLSTDLQTKLLLFLDSKSARPVGSNQSYKANARLLFASGRELEPLVESGHMRKDFYFRLSSEYKFKLFALRENVGRIDRICQDFALCEKVVISPKLVTFYKSLPWPGNIRQLLAHLKKKKVFSRSRRLMFDKIDESLLCSSSSLTRIAEQTFPTLGEIKGGHARRVYEYCDHNIKAAAQVLDIAPQTVRGLIKQNVGLDAH